MGMDKNQEKLRVNLKKFILIFEATDLARFLFPWLLFFSIKELNLLKEKNQIDFISFCLPIYYDVVVVQYIVLLVSYKYI